MNNDLISREDLKKAIDAITQTGYDIENKPLFDYVELPDLIKAIDNAPAAEPEITNDDLQAAMTESWHLGYELAETKFKRPTGEWIKNEGKDIRDNFYTCSKCGRSINVICGETLADYPFCHCGADMRVKDELNRVKDELEEAENETDN